MIRTLMAFATLALLSTGIYAEPGSEANTASDPATATATTEQTGTESSASDSAGKGKIARAIFTTDIQDREPVDDISSFSNGEQPVYFFTDLRDFTGETLTHRWEYNGQVMAEVAIEVGGPRWRAYSQKAMLPQWSGTWTVTVLDSTNNPIQVSTLEVSPPQVTPQQDNTQTTVQ